MFELTDEAREWYVDRGRWLRRSGGTAIMGGLLSRAMRLIDGFKGVGDAAVYCDPI
jgi:hypothetical protein